MGGDRDHGVPQPKDEARGVRQLKRGGRLVNDGGHGLRMNDGDQGIPQRSRADWRVWRGRHGRLQRRSEVSGPDDYLLREKGDV